MQQELFGIDAGDKAILMLTGRAQGDVINAGNRHRGRHSRSNQVRGFVLNGAPLSTHLRRLRDPQKS